MHDSDFQLIIRAKRQIHRDRALRSFLLVGLVFAAALRLFGIELPFFYLMLFVVLLISLIFSSDLISNIGQVSKSDLIDVLEKHLHSDPDMLTRYLNSRRV
jgi:hypothetical protein